MILRERTLREVKAGCAEGKQAQARQRPPVALRGAQQRPSQQRGARDGKPQRD